MDALQERLTEVIERGAPAQRDEARRLKSLLDADPGNVEALSAAGLLIDAYVHDPYLDKGHGPYLDKGHGHADYRRS